MIAAAVLSGGCGQVSDMLGLSSQPAKGSASVENQTAAVEASATGATPGATAKTAATQPSATSPRPRRKRDAGSVGSARTGTAAAFNPAVNSPSTEVALVDADTALESRVGTRSAPAVAPTVAGARPGVFDERRIYTPEDADVVPARLISTPTTGPVFRNMASSVNTMELIVSKQGRVEEVKLTSPSRKMTDMLLLSGAKTWKFVPATKDGQPVRYRTQFSWEETP
jgi:hypothetical protein